MEDCAMTCTLFEKKNNCDFNNYRINAFVTFLSISTY